MWRSVGLGWRGESRGGARADGGVGSAERLEGESMTTRSNRTERCPSSRNPTLFQQHAFIRSTGVCAFCGAVRTAATPDELRQLAADKDTELRLLGRADRWVTADGVRTCSWRPGSFCWMRCRCSRVGLRMADRLRGVTR